jgi:Fur family ferric uptake transcriptional regulator
MAAQRKSASDDTLRDMLKEKGLRVTEQRMILLRELVRQSNPISHAELTETLAHMGLDRVTVYRNLVSMAELGLVVRTQLGDGVWRFEIPSGKSRRHEGHPHFVCTNCGDISCLTESDVLLRGDVTRNEVQDVQIRGRCRACRR